MSQKVLFDTNVLIAASLLAASTELTVKIEHQFSRISCDLLDFVEQHSRKRIGIVTQFVENEAHFNLETSITTELNRRDDNREIDFEIFSVLLNTCTDRLRFFITVLSFEPVDETSINTGRKRVEAMYDDLMQQANRIRDQNQTRQKSSAKRYRKILGQIYRSQEHTIDAQLIQLLDNPAEYSDMRILAEAKYLLELYKQTESSDVVLFIASCDHHFSPIRKQDIISKQITDKIYELFEIRCDYPNQILPLLKKGVK